MAHSQDPVSTTHLLSKKSRSLRRDTFFFRPEYNGGLLGGLNQSVTPITSQKLHRWVHLLGESDLFELRPITLGYTPGVLVYSKSFTGPSILAESTDPLPAGDYLWIESEASNSQHLPFAQCGPAMTFAQLKSGAEQPGPHEHLAKFLHYYNIPSLVVESVTARDHGYCAITGSSSYDAELKVSWIFPPAWANWLRNTEYFNERVAMSKASNAMLMRKDLIDAFHDNAFGIDVDDDYRVVVFREIGPVQGLLTKANSTTNPQAFFRRPRQGSSAQFTGPDDFFLRAHFKHCLRFHMLHGEIEADYPEPVILQAMQDHGLSGPRDAMLSLEDQRWQTELGMEIFASNLEYVKGLKAAMSLSRGQSE